MRQNMAGKFGHIKWRIRVFGHNWMTAWCRRDSYLSERLSHLTQEVLGQLDGFVHRQVQTAVTDVLLNPARKLPPFVCSGVTLWAGHTRWSHEHTPTGHKGFLFYGETQDWVITHLVSKNHESVVCLSSDGSANTLGSVAHGIKRQKVILSDLKVIPQVLQASLKRASEGKTSMSALNNGAVSHLKICVEGAGCAAADSSSDLQDATLRVNIRNSKHDDCSAKMVHWTETQTWYKVSKVEHTHTHTHTGLQV